MTILAGATHFVWCRNVVENVYQRGKSSFSRLQSLFDRSNKENKLQLNQPNSNQVQASILSKPTKKTLDLSTMIPGGAKENRQQTVPFTYAKKPMPSARTYTQQPLSSARVEQSVNYKPKVTTEAPIYDSVGPVKPLSHKTRSLPEVPKPQEPLYVEMKNPTYAQPQDALRAGEPIYAEIQGKPMNKKQEQEQLMKKFRGDEDDVSNQLIANRKNQLKQQKNEPIYSEPQKKEPINLAQRPLPPLPVQMKNK